MEMRIFKRNAAIGVVAATFGFVAQAVAAQTVHIPDLAMLTTRVQQAHPEFVATRATLMAAIADYNVRARQLTSDCHGVDPDDQTRIENCQNRQAQLRVELRSLVGRATAFNASVDDALENAPYRPSGNGMVGGTGWIVGYNVPKPTPELIAKSRAMLAEQERLAGHTYADAIDFDHYNFVIGIAADTDFGWDLVKRVALPDEETAGQYSIENQPGYAALAGRSFNDLACHSNGAMVCLAALKCRDVKADNVTLYGPQITQEALEQWDGLVRSGQVKSVTLRRQFITLPAKSLGGILLYTLAGEPIRAQDLQTGDIHVPLRFFTAAEARVIEAARADSSFPSDEAVQARSKPQW